MTGQFTVIGDVTEASVRSNHVQAFTVVVFSLTRRKKDVRPLLFSVSSKYECRKGSEL